MSGSLDDVRRNDSTMANTIDPTKRGRRRSNSAGGGVYGQALTSDQRVATVTSVRASRHHEGDLVSWGHCCGIHGAARERAGIKHGRVTARRRLEKELIQKEMDEL